MDPVEADGGAAGRAAGVRDAARTANLASKMPGPGRARLLFRMAGREQYIRQLPVLREGVPVAA